MKLGGYDFHKGNQKANGLNQIETTTCGGLQMKGEISAGSGNEKNTKASALNTSHTH